MRSLFGAAVGVVALCLVAGPALAGGECCEKIAKAGEGWCDKCNHGEALGFHLASKKVYSSLTGTPFAESGMKDAPCCQKANKENGTCSGCKVSFANNKMYKSPYAHDVAVGTRIDPASPPKCENCKKLVASKDGGWCDTCKAGVAGGYIYKTKEGYDAAVKARAVLAKAVAAAGKCETCGVAMATDGSCEACKVTYKAGEKATK